MICSLCGSSLPEVEDNDVYVCPKCNKPYCLDCSPEYIDDLCPLCEGTEDVFNYFYGLGEALGREKWIVCSL